MALLRSLILLAIGLSLTAALNPAARAHDHAGMDEKSTVLITGANRGIGLEFAKQYTDAGWNVIGTARNPETADELRATGATILELDVLDQSTIDALVESLDGQPIDLLINNAGIFPRVSSINEVDFDDYARTLAVNTTGPARVTQALLSNVAQSKAKTIINISSGLGSIENTTSGVFYGYRESKAALNMLSRTLGMELKADGFIVAAVHPGWVQTDMGGANANLTPSESVSAMRETIAKLTVDDTGTYWSYDGQPVAW